MTLLEAYILFGLPALALLIGLGAILLVRADYKKDPARIGE